MVAIRGGTPDMSALDRISAGTVTWDGIDFVNLDLTGASSGIDKAAALTTLLKDARLPVEVKFIDGRFFAFHHWLPSRTPAFENADAFGLNAEDAETPIGPFVRPREQALNVTSDITRVRGFFGDSLNDIRQSLQTLVSGLDIGSQIWLNDFLVAIESVPGTRVTSLAVQSNDADIAGVTPPLDTLWTLPPINIELNVV